MAAVQWVLGRILGHAACLQDDSTGAGDLNVGEHLLSPSIESGVEPHRFF